MPISMSVKVTVPEQILNVDAVVDAIERKMKSKTGPDLQAEFQKTVDGWTNPPRFKPEYRFSHSIATQVFTDSERYIWVNNGTDPHRITPRRGGLLRFQTGYRAATRPKSISSSRPSRFGAVVTARAVNHPGVEARLFDEVIANEYQDTFVNDMQEAINGAVKGSSVSRR